MIQQGVFIPPSQFESWFLCSSLSKDEVKKVTLGIQAALKKVSETLEVSH
jgi:glutamate-1-semialdehyde 2,1-aminomutase